MSITFSKPGVVTCTGDKARSFPVGNALGRRQESGESGGGIVKVADLGNEDEFITVILNNLSATNIAALKTFLRDSLVNWRANTFTFTDEASNTYTVRYWNSKNLLRQSEITDDLISVKIDLKVEIT